MGETLTYTLKVTNNGPNTATNIVITDNLPANTTFVSASSGCADSGGTVTCNVSDLASGESAERQIVVRPTASGTITNTASVRSDTTDPNPDNNSATTTTRAIAANLSITKEDAPDPVLVNGDFSYILRVSNAAGAADATNVRITDTLPDGVTLDGPLPTGCTSSTETDGRITVTCNLGTVNAGNSVTVTINVTAPGTPGTISNTATVSSPNDPTDASDTEETTVVAAANLSIAKEDDPDPVDVGDDLTYTLTVTNEGPSDATGVMAIDELPDEVTFDSATFTNGATTGNCTQASGTVTCDLGTINAGNSATVTVMVRPTAAGIIENTAKVSSATDDPDTTDNEATESTTADGDNDRNDGNGDGDDGDEGGDDGDGDNGNGDGDGDDGDDGSDGDNDGDNVSDDGDNGDDGDGDSDALEDGVDVTKDDEIKDRTGQPDGQVIDTSKLSQLPNTGGPSLPGKALVIVMIGSALLGVGVGVPAWQLVSRRGRGG